MLRCLVSMPRVRGPPLNPPIEAGSDLDKLPRSRRNLDRGLDTAPDLRDKGLPPHLPASLSFSPLTTANGILLKC